QRGVQDHRHPRDDDVAGDRRQHEDVQRHEPVAHSPPPRLPVRIITICLASAPHGHAPCQPRPGPCVSLHMAGAIPRRPTIWATMLLLAPAKLGPVNAEVPPPSPEPVTLEAFLRGIDARAFRFAELGLRHREDALDAVQDAMLKMLAYRDRPASEWSPLFWSILRNRMVDMQRRGLFRLRWLLPGSTDKDGEPIDWADDAPDPSRSHDSHVAWEQISRALRKLPARQREA